MYICTLPTYESWDKLQEKAFIAGGTYLSDDIRLSHGVHLGNCITCWESFETPQQRYEHQLEKHFNYIDEIEDKDWFLKKIKRYIKL